MAPVLVAAAGWSHGNAEARSGHPQHLQRLLVPGRPSTEDLRRDLDEVTREIRPDWDLVASGLREAREAGDDSMHHPYQQADHVPKAA